MFGDDWGVEPTAPEEPTTYAAGGPGHRALYLKWRPRRFQEVVGQEHVTRTLRNAVMRRQLAHAYLFTGPRGTGKTSVARILYRAANCERSVDGDPCNACPLCVAALEGRAMELVEIDAASNRGIDDIRDLREKVAFRPSEGRHRLYIIDEAHELTSPAWDAFLKTLEEPPAHAIFVLATTEAHKVPATIVSRCQRFDFRRIPFEATRERLARVAAAEKLEVEPIVLERLARVARGGLRDALSLLDQLAAFAGGRVDMQVARAVLGFPPVEAVRGVIEALGRRDAADVIARLADVAEGGADLRQFVEELTGNLRALLVARAGGEATLAPDFGAEELAWLQQQAPAWTVGMLIALVQELANALARTRDSQQFQVQVELSLLRMCDPGSGEVSEILTSHPSTRTVAHSAGAALPRRVAAPLGKPGSDSQGQPQPDVSTAIPEGVEPSPSRPTAQGHARALKAPPSDHGYSAAEVLDGGVAPRRLEARELMATRVNWAELVDYLKQAAGSPVRAALSTAKLLSIEGNTLVVDFGSSIHRRTAERNREVIEQAIREALKQPYKLKCVVGSDNATPALLEDPVIIFAVRKFGGEPRRLE